MNNNGLLSVIHSGGPAVNTNINGEAFFQGGITFSDPQWGACKYIHH